MDIVYFGFDGGQVAGAGGNRAFEDYSRGTFDTEIKSREAEVGRVVSEN